MRSWKLFDDYEIREVTFEELETFFKSHRDKGFEETYMFSTENLYSEEEKRFLDQERDKNLSSFRINLMLFHKDNACGWCFGRQKDYDTFKMTNSVVFSEHRRKGLYTELMNKTMELAKKRGFQVISSRHNSTNNAVIIPKLKAGFVISSVEISDIFGTLVHLSYFTNKTRRKMMDVRSGLCRPDEDLLQYLS